MSEARDLQVLTDPVGVYACTGCGVKLDLEGRTAFSMVRCPSCRIEMQVPARMGGFVLAELIGVGGMGSVYRARDEALNRDAAIKIMRKSFGDDPQFVETFQREAQTAAKLNHPNVVHIYSFGEFKGQPFIVMEMVTGGSLDRLIATGEPINQTMVMRIGMEITSALQSGYQMQLVHGDIKPENILIDEKGAGKLVDFGIAQLAGVGGDNKEVWGTPYYVAPEKVRRQRTDCRADIYSLGGTLFHALAGKPPFDGPDATAVVKARFLKPAPPLRELRRDIDPEVEAIVARMLQVEPSMRYPTYESLLGDMHRYIDRAAPVSVSTKKVIIVTKKKGPGSTNPIPATVKAAPLGTPSTTPVATINVPKTPNVIIKPTTTPSTGRMASVQPRSSGSTPVARPVNTGVPVAVVIMLVLFFMLLICAVGFGVWYVVKHPGSAAPVVESTQNTTQAAQAAQAVAMQRIGDCLLQTQSAGSNLLIGAETARQLCEAANKAVTDVLPDAHNSLIPLRPEVKLSSPAAAVAGATNAAAGGTNAVPEAPAAVDPELLKKEPVIGNVRDMYLARYCMEDIADATTALYDEISGVSTSSSNMPPEALNLRADAFTERIQSFVATGSKADESHRKLAHIRNSLMLVSNQVAVIRKRLDKEAALVRLAAEQEKQKQEAQKREEARQEKIKSEIAGIRAKEDEKDFKEALHKFAFKDARQQLHIVLSTLTEDESLKAYAIATQRVARIEELCDFMIKHLPGYQDQNSWSIESADKNGIVVKNKNGSTDVAWKDVGDRRMVPFIKYFLMDPSGSRDPKLREHVRMLINSALYCRKYVPDAQLLADAMLEKAVLKLPDSKDDIELLLPGAGLKVNPNKPVDKPEAEAAPK